MQTPLEALNEAVRATGGQSALGRMIGRSQPSISYWLNKLGRVPAEDVIAVERASGIPRERLRPDIYPDAPYHSTPPAVSRQDTEKTATNVAGGKACSAPPGAGAALEPIVICALCERELMPARKGACQYLDCPSKERE